MGTPGTSGRLQGVTSLRPLWGQLCFPSTCSWLSRKHQVTSASRCYHFGDCLDLYSGMVDMGDPDHGTEGTGGHVAHQICSTTRGTQSSVCSSVCHTRFSLSQTRCRIAQQGVPGGPGLSPTQWR